MPKYNVDIPYLEPLLLHLMKDESLEKYFTKKDFFTMPKTDMGDLEQALKDCPAPRSVYVFPGVSSSATQQRSGTCTPKALHSFNIVIVFQCIRNTFTFSKDNDGNVFLDGQFMELSEARKALKNSISKFNKTLNSPMPNSHGFDFLSWMGDEMLYPEESGGSFLVSSSTFQTMIL